MLEIVDVKFPGDFKFELTADELNEVATNCDRLRFF